MGPVLFLGVTMTVVGLVGIFTVGLAFIFFCGVLNTAVAARGSNSVVSEPCFFFTTLFISDWSGREADLEIPSFSFLFLLLSQLGRVPGPKSDPRSRLIPAEEAADLVEMVTGDEGVD